MTNRHADIQVGLFAIIGLLLLAMLILIFGGFEDVFIATYEVTALFENASGVTVRAPVRLQGIDVGTVRNISLDRETGGVKMTLRIDRNVDIREDAPLLIKQEGFIANLYLEFGTGRSEDMLPKDGTAQVEGDTATFASYIERATNVVSEMSGSIQERIRDLSIRLVSLADSFDNLVGDRDFQDDFKGLITTTGQVSHTLSEKLGPMMDNLTLAASRAEASLEKTASLLETYQELGEELTTLSRGGSEQLQRQGANLDQLTASIVESANSIASLAEGLNEVTDMAKSGDGTIGRLFTDVELYRSLVDSVDEIEEASRMIKELAETLKRHPDWLIKGPPEDRR